MEGELHTCSPKCLRVLGAHCAPVTAFLFWRRRDRLRLLMVPRVMGIVRGFWCGLASKRRQPCKLLLPCILAISLGMPIIYPGNLENVFSLVLQNVNCVPRDSEHLSLTEAPTCVSVHYLLITGCVGGLLLCYFWRGLFGWVFFNSVS